MKFSAHGRVPPPGRNPARAQRNRAAVSLRRRHWRNRNHRSGFASLLRSLQPHPHHLGRQNPHLPVFGVGPRLARTHAARRFRRRAGGIHPRRGQRKEERHHIGEARLRSSIKNATVGDLAWNAQRILDGIEAAKQARAELVLFPELALTGYPPEDLLLREHFLKDTGAQLQRLAAAAEGIVAIVGFPERIPGAVPARARIAGTDRDRPVQRRRRARGRRRRAGLPQGAPAQLRGVRRAALLQVRRSPRHGDRACRSGGRSRTKSRSGTAGGPGTGDRRRTADRRDSVRGPVGGRRTGHFGGKRRGNTDREHLRIAVSRRQGLSASACSASVPAKRAPMSPSARWSAVRTNSYSMGTRSC